MWYYTEGVKLLYSKVAIFRVQSGKKLHRAENIYTDTVCGVCDKYQVCIIIPADMSKNSGLSKARRPKIQILLKTIYILALKKK